MTSGYQPGQRLGPYEIQSLLGRGGMGEVYLAEDLRLGRKVAIKVLTERSVEDPTSAGRFAREARAASALNHPNIVTVHDIGRTDDGPFLVMEFVEGRSLRTAMDALDVPGALRVAAETALALAAAHDAGIVHRDVKPENIMLRPDGYVKVLDFGIARRLREEDLEPPPDETVTDETEVLTHGGAAIGTPHYMSPEQASGADITAASDVFSLGVVLYEMLTRTKPFSGRDRFEVLHRIVAVDPAWPAAVTPSIPQHVDALVRRMLAKSPVDRPTAREVAALLSASPSGPAEVRSVRARLVGRERESARLAGEIEAASQGSGHIVLVQGEPGMGKSALVESMLDHPAAARFRIGRGRCSERLGGAEAYLPVLEALEMLVAGPGGSEIDEFMRLRAPSWHHQVVTTEDAPAGPPGNPDRARREFVRFLEALTRRTPVLLFFEDVHWSDTATVDLLAYLSTAIASMRLVVIATFRASDLARAQHPLGQIKLDWQARGVCREISLDLLTMEHVSQFIDRECPGHQLPAEFARTIHTRTGGSPLFLVEMLRYLKDRGALADEGGWRLAAPLEDVVRDVPESVRSMIERKIGQLDDGDRRLLTVAAVQGFEFDSATLAEAAHIEPAVVEERLDQIDRTMALVAFRADGEFPDGTLTLRYAFRHAMYYDALFAQCRITQRAQLSRAVAETLERRYRDAAGEIASQLAYLFENARDAVRAARYWAGAAREALGHAAPREAVALGERGLALLTKLPDSAERDAAEAELRLAMSLPETMLGGFAAARLEPLYLRLREIGERRGDSRALLAALTGLFSWHGSRSECAQSLAIGEALARTAAEMGDADEMVNADRTLGFILMHLGRLRECEAAFDRSCARFDAARSRWQVERYAFDPLAAAHSFTGVTRCLQGYCETAVARERAGVERAQVAQSPVSSGLALSFTAKVHQLREEPVEALRAADAAVDLATRLEMPLFCGYGWVWGGWALARMGNREGLERLVRGLDVQLQIGNSIGRGHFLTLLADARWSLGDREGAARAIEESLEFTARSGNVYYEAETWRWHGIVSGEAGSFRRALEVARAQGALLFELRAAASLGDEEAVRQARAKFPEAPPAAARAV